MLPVQAILWKPSCSNHPVQTILFGSLSDWLSWLSNALIKTIFFSATLFAEIGDIPKAGACINREGIISITIMSRFPSISASCPSCPEDAPFWKKTPPFQAIAVPVELCLM
jgi:hypothetical protein